VLTWHPAELAAVTCMREEPISLQGRGAVRGPLAVGIVFKTLRSLHSVRYIFLLFLVKAAPRMETSWPV